MRNLKLLSLIAAAGLLATAPACKQAAREKAAGTSAVGAAPVKIFKVQRERITEKLTYTGTLEAWNTINITPETGGKIARIHVQEGDRVGKGQLLAELETSSIRLQLKQAEAAQAVAEANQANAKTNLERMDRLVKEDAVSDQQHEQVKLAFDAAVAQLAQAQAAVNLAKYSLDVSIMRAPFAGVIASKNAEVGDVINPMMGGFGGGAGGVLTLMDYSKIKLAVAISSEDIGRIRKGQEAVLRVGSLPGRDFRGTVNVVNLTADPLNKKFGVEVVIDNRDAVLRPGTFGNLVFEVQSHDNALVVPQAAILENSYVFAAEGGQAVRKNVTLGIQNTTMIEILGGLGDGESVIVEGNYGLEEGAPVQILEEVTK